MRFNAAQIDAMRDIVAEMDYQMALDSAVRSARKVLAAAGCTLRKQGCYVSLVSPRTGTHTLNMTRGVRPVSDLLTHVHGFAENQPPRQPILPAFAAVLNQ